MSWKIGDRALCVRDLWDNRGFTCGNDPVKGVVYIVTDVRRCVGRNGDDITGLQLAGVGCKTLRSFLFFFRRTGVDAYYTSVAFRKIVPACDHADNIEQFSQPKTR